MKVIQGKTFDEVYRKSIMEILKGGDLVSPRGVNTYELAPATLIIDEPRYFLTTPKARKGNYIFQLAELFWILSGSDDTKMISHYNKQWLKFTDDNEDILNGAYGKRIRDWYGEDQLLSVFEKLKRDPYSRQAVIVLFDPERDNYIFESTDSYSKDIPCTNYFNFQIRDGKLNMGVVMRSNDLHKGSIYDIPNFITIQHILAGWLDVEVGKYTHTAFSFHIYESDIENLIDIYNTKDDVNPYVGVDIDESPKLSFEEFNFTMPKIMFLETQTRALVDDMDALVLFENTAHDFLNKIEHPWWRSMAACLVIYNYRKAGFNENTFHQFLPYVTNEYRGIVSNYKQIKKQG